MLYLTRKSRYSLNRSIEKNGEKGYICGQGLGFTAGMRYGLCPMSFNGCECISVYNALIYLGRPAALSDIAAYLERCKMLFGIFGCDPHKLGVAFDAFGADWKKTDCPQNEQAFIISYWTGRRFLSSIHTVFCVRKDDGIHVFNRYNNSDRVYLISSSEELTGNRKPIAVYIISRQNDNQSL